MFRSTPALQNAALLTAAAFGFLLAAGCGESRRPPQATGAGATTMGGQIEADPKIVPSAPRDDAHSVTNEVSAATNVPPAAVSPVPAIPPERPVVEETEETPAKPLPPPPEVEGLIRLDPKADVWIDKAKKRVVLVGQTCRREGQLEMFACLKNSKEHESIVAVDTKAMLVNTALLLIGATQGNPVQFRPEFKPASGPEVEVTVIWTDAKGKRQQVRAQEWIRHIKTGKAMQHAWVFGGSGFWVDDEGKNHFMAEDGDVICISNFTSAILDLPVESSQASSELEFEAFTERIPPVKTQVVVILTPKLKKAEAKPAETKPKADESK